MNLTEALETSLPEIPALTREFKPRLHPNLIWREQVENGKPIISALVPTKGFVFRFSPQEWELLQLYDGQRTLQEVADEFYARTGVQYTPEELRQNVDFLDEWNLWYKTPLEENIALKQRLAEERKKKTKRKSKYGDLSHLEFGARDPDRALTWIYPRLKFIYSPWFAVVSGAAFLFMLYVFWDQWGQIGHDTYLFYNFREKSFRDIVEFWCLSCLMLFIHEFFGHGLACKHYGGHVHRMGFLLLYTLPAFFTDASEVFVVGKKWQRINTIFWGAYSEILVCAIATPIWWGTAPGSLAHEWAYKMMLITGLAVFVFNWNPLIKLDGYYLLTEILGWPDLKEESTAYVSGWVKHHIWRLPVQVPFVPQRRRIPYTVYALLSGLYSYTLLSFFARLFGNIATSFSPEWGFLVGLLVAYRIFRSRIFTLGRFMKTVYLDKKERVEGWLTPRRKLMGGVALALFLVLPLWREAVEGRFMLEPVNRAVLRAAVPGTVVEANAQEGRRIVAGETLLRLRNLNLESQAAQTQADYRVAVSRATEAQLRYVGFGTAERERQQLAARSRLLDDQVTMLTIASPMAGQVMTPRVADRIGSRVEAGTELVEVADLSTLRARIYLPEFAVRKTEVGANARLLLDAGVLPIPGKVLSMAPASSEIEPGLTESVQFRGTRPPTFYAVTIEVANPKGELKAGMAGTAVIYSGHHSIAWMVGEAIYDFFGRKIW